MFKKTVKPLILILSIAFLIMVIYRGVRHEFRHTKIPSNKTSSSYLAKKLNKTNPNIIIKNNNSATSKESIEKVVNSNKAIYSDKIICSNKSMYYTPYIQVGGAHFFNIKNSNNSVVIDLFIPLWQQPTNLVFTDLRVFDRSGKSFEGNLHLGYRHLNQDKQRLCGIYGAFDRKKTEDGNYFNQLTLGGEFWHKKWFFGGNIYKIIGETTKTIKETTVENVELRQSGRYKNIWITTAGTQEKSMSGTDAEVGYEFIKGLTGYAGGYYFRAKDINTVCGPRVRLTYDWSIDNGKKVLGLFDKVGFEAGAQRDNPRGFTWYLGVNVRLGMSSKRPVLEGVSRHMVDIVRRDIDIVASSKKLRTQTAVTNQNGKIVNILSVSTSKELDAAMVDDDAHVIAVTKTINYSTIAPADIIKKVRTTKKLAFGKTTVSAYGTTLQVPLPSTPGEIPKIDGIAGRTIVAILSGKVVTPESQNHSQQEIILLPNKDRKDVVDITKQLIVEKEYINTLNRSSFVEKEKIKELATEIANYKKMEQALGQEARDKSIDLTKTTWEMAQEFTKSLLYSETNPGVLRQVAIDVALNLNPKATPKGETLKEQILSLPKKSQYKINPRDILKKMH